MVQHQRLRGECAVHIRQRAKDPDSRTGLLQSRYLDSEVVPPFWRCERGYQVRVVQRDERRESRQSQHHCRRRELRAHLVCPRGQTEPGRGQVALLTRDSGFGARDSKAISTANRYSGATAIVAAMVVIAPGFAAAQGAQGWRERTVVPIGSGEWTGP